MLILVLCYVMASVMVVLVLHGGLSLVIPGNQFPDPPMHLAEGLAATIQAAQALPRLFLVGVSVSFVFLLPRRAWMPV